MYNQIGDWMKTIINNCCNEIVIKNSRFITFLFKFYDNDDVNNYLNIVRDKYPKATHYTYAYITESFRKSSDDGEPGGTAGVPMLSILEKEDLINCLVITVRYFGGIKLGAGGLVRAYSKSVRDSINSDNLCDLEYGYEIEIITSYDKQKELDYLLKDYEIINKYYDENVVYIVLIPINDLNLICNYKYNIINNRLIKKVAK